MALYESVIIGRQDLTPNQFEELVEGFTKIIENFKGVIKKREIWGLRNLAYKINKNRKSSYSNMFIDYCHKKNKDKTSLFSGFTEIFSMY